MKHLLKALASARAELGGAIRPDSKGQYNLYASLAHTLHTIDTVAAKHGLLNLQRPMDVPGAAIETTIFHLESGESITSKYPLSTDGPGPQKMGAAETYARRRSLCTLYGLATEDDDPDQMPKQKPQQAVAKPQQSAPTKAPQPAQKAQPVQSEKTSRFTIADAENFTVNWGKYKGVRLGGLDHPELCQVEQYCCWLALKSKEENKPPSKNATDLHNAVITLLQAHADMAIPFREYPE